MIVTAPALARPGDEVTVRVVPQKSTVHPGDQIAIAVVFEHQPGWHTWPEESVVLAKSVAETAADNRTKITPEKTPGWIAKVGPIQWPATSLNKVPDPDVGPQPTYSGTAVAFVPVIVAENAPVGEQSWKVTTFFQACNDSTCLFPTENELPVTLTVVPAGTPTTATNDPALFSTFDLGVFQRMASGAASAQLSRARFNVFGWQFTIDPNGALGLGLLLLAAVVGGLLLNFTPCVLPVIPIKILGLSQAAGNPRRCLLLGVVMSLGVVAFWLAIGGAIAFISGFTAISSLFQQVWFSIIVGIIIAAMAMGMLGLFATRLPQWVYRINPSHETLHGSFLFGIMTAVLSTPCTAPFMGSAAAWAATQAPALTLLTFGAIGVGMAVPYLVLAANPKWVDRMPRTGPASELIKQVMGFLMLGVAAFFLGIGLAAVLARPPAPPTRVYWWAVAFFVTLAGVWLIYRTFKITSVSRRRLVFAVVGLLLGTGSIALAFPLSSHGPINWVYYTPSQFKQAISSGKVVVMDFTAEWCLNCKAQESGVLHRREIARLLNDKDRVVPIKVDLTGNNADGKAKLKELNWVGIPLLAIFGPGLGPEGPIKMDSYTPEMVKNALERAGARGVASSSP